MRHWIKTFDHWGRKMLRHDIEFCRRNNFNRMLKNDRAVFGESGGSIITEMLTAELNHPTGHVYIIHNGSSNMGWAIAYLNDEDEQYEFQCFINEKFRRRGLASRLLERATKEFGKLRVFPHEQNEGFFLTHGINEDEALIDPTKIVKKKVK